MDINASGILPLSTIILPPGSTTANLQAAINSAATGDVIELSSNMTFSGAVTVPAGRSLTIRSTAGNAWTLTYTAAANRHFLVDGTLTLASIVLYGGTTFNPDGSVLSAGAGGVHVASGGSLTLAAGAIIQNCYATDGGGISTSSAASVVINGGIVRLNAANNGGGIFANGPVTLNTGAIDNNRAALIGGGIYFYASSASVNLLGGTVSGNRAVGNAGIGGSGGGVYAYQMSSIINLDGAEISGNTAINGGGIMSSGTVNMISGSIVENNATTGGGGYISGYSMSGPLETWNMSGGVIRGNTATNGGGIYARGNFPGTAVNISGGEIIENRADRGAGVYLSLETGGSSVFIMNDGRISANIATYNGGGVYASNGASVTLNGGVIGGATPDQGNRASSGGGLYVTGLLGALFMNGGVVGYNAASGTGFGGGGIHLDGSSMTMTDGTINGITSAGSGGGVYMYNNNSIIGVTTNTFTFEDGVISGNTAERNGGGVLLEALNSNLAVLIILQGAVSGNSALRGGGVYASSNGSIDMMGGAISGNFASDDGGGVYVNATSAFTTAGPTAITGNTAGGSGGGIYTTVPDYGNLLTGAQTQFEANRASAAYAPPANAAALYPDLGFASVSVADHPLNNFDINYTEGEVLLITVTFGPNGGTGDTASVDLPYGSPYTIPSPAELNITREGYTFVQWNTSPDGGGTAYLPGQVVNVTGDLSLYALWAPLVTQLTVTYVANGGTGSRVDSVTSGTAYRVLTAAEAGIHRACFRFVGWNTSPGGNGTIYAPGTLVTLINDLVLYAQWRAISQPCNPCNPCSPCNPCNPCNPCDPCSPCNPCNPCDPCNRCRPCRGTCRNPCNPCARTPFAPELWPNQSPYSAFHGPSIHRAPYGNTPCGLYRQSAYARGIWTR